MMNSKKTVEELTESDLRDVPVWQFTNSDEDETVVRPVSKIPVETLANRVVAVQVTLANRSHRWALIGNVDPTNARLTRHFFTLSILDHGRWFNLARYHDVDATERGPEALASVLGLPVDAVFPIVYDISAYVTGDRGAVAGTLEKEPRERLTRAQIIALALP